MDYQRLALISYLVPDLLVGDMYVWYICIYVCVYIYLYTHIILNIKLYKTIWIIWKSEKQKAILLKIFFT